MFLVGEFARFLFTQMFVYYAHAHAAFTRILQLSRGLSRFLWCRDKKFQEIFFKRFVLITGFNTKSSTPLGNSLHISEEYKAMILMW